MSNIDFSLVGVAVVFIATAYYVSNEVISLAHDYYEEDRIRAKKLAAKKAKKLAKQKEEELLESLKKPKQKYSVDVFLRIRPLVGMEIEQKHDEIEYKITNKKNGKQSIAIKKDNKRVGIRELRKAKKKGKSIDNYGKGYKGFKWILTPDNDNVYTYNTCIKNSVDNIFDGLATCVFAYGHTGSGTDILSDIIWMWLY